MHPTSDTARRVAAIAHLREDVQRVAEHVVARAHAARQLGATAHTYRAYALNLEWQAGRAAGLLFGQAVETSRAVAAEHRLIADALDMIEGGNTDW